MSAPQLDRTCAREILALVDVAGARAPGHELAWRVGWGMRAAGEPVAAPPNDPRREPEVSTGNGSQPLGRVSKRPPP